MRAIFASRAGGPEVLEAVEVPIPEPAQDEVLIRVVSAGVNFADIVTTQRPHWGSATPPFIPGREVAGIEVATGRPVLALVPAGGYAEYVVAPRLLTFDATGLDLERMGGALLVLLTSYFALRHFARLQQGEAVLLTAAGGGVGSTAIQISRNLGAGRIVAVASSAEKREFAASLGADECIDYSEPFPDVDVVVDGVGGAVFTTAFAAVRQLGRIVALGEASGVAPVVPDYESLRRCNVGVFSFSLRAYRDLFPAETARLSEPALQMLRDGSVTPMVSSSMPLADAAPAWESILSRRAQGKIVLLP